MADDDKTIDIDDMDDKAFEELKAGMLAEEPVEDDAEPTPEPPTETKGDRDDKGRFAKKADEPKAEDVAQDDDDPDDDDIAADGDKQRTVPHQRFHKEREQRKEEARLRKEAEDRFAILADRLAQLQTAQQPQKAEPEPPEIPDPNINPVGGITWAVDTLKAQIEQQNRTKAEQEAAQAEEQQWARAQAFAQQQFAQAEQSDQDLRPAYDHLLKSFTAEAQAYGLQGPALEQHLQQVEREQIRYALQNNMSIPEYVKGLAKARGYSGPPVQAEPAPAKDAVKEITEREEARKASLSLGKTGGGVSNTDRITPERLLEMNDSEFAAFKEKYGSIGAVFNA